MHWINIIDTSTEQNDLRINYDQLFSNHPMRWRLRHDYRVGRFHETMARLPRVLVPTLGATTAGSVDFFVVERVTLMVPERVTAGRTWAVLSLAFMVIARLGRDVLDPSIPIQGQQMSVSIKPNGTYCR